MKPLYLQFLLFIALLALGIVVGILFDVYRVSRAILRPRKRMTQVGDFLFWVVITILVLLLLFLGNWGEFRLFVLLALALGVVVYFPVASPFVLRVLVFLVNLLWRVGRFMRKVLLFLWRCLMVPVVWVYMILSVPVRVIKRVKRRVKVKMRRKTRQIRRRMSRRIRTKLRAFKAKLKAKLFPPKDDE